MRVLTPPGSETPTVSSLRVNEQGMVTAETAVVLPTLVLIAAILVGTLWVGAAQAEINESARFLARSMSQGDSRAEAKRRLGPGGKDLKVTVKDSGDIITVHVSKRVAVRPVPRFAVTLAGSSTAVKE